MKKTIQILFIFLLSFPVFGQKVTDDEIISASKNFINQSSSFFNYSVDVTKDIQPLSYNNIIVGYLVNLSPKGFIIFSASKKSYPVFGFSNEGNFNVSSQNSNLNFLISYLYIEASSLNTAPKQQVIEANLKKWEELLNFKSSPKDEIKYGYWLNDVWGGVNCYDNNGNVIYVGNYFTPNHYSPGCVATSLSQILHYYEWPPRGNGTHTNYDNSGSSQNSYYAKFEATEYDWDNMLNQYYGRPSNDIKQRAMGLLAYHCGVAVDMDYENTGSTASVTDIPNALISYFRALGHYETSSWVSFRTRLEENLENAHPVILAGKADNGDQHAFVCDGYKYDVSTPNDKYYHLNMGWWNSYGLNGWYRIFDDFNVGGYNQILSGVFDILPVAFMNKPLYTNDAHTFYIRWQMPKNVNVTAYLVEESFDNGTWTEITSSVADTFLLHTVTQDGQYKYRVKAQIDGVWYADSYSNYVTVPVGESSYLNFDGDDSFFVNDNIYNNMDIDSAWTIETWVKVDTYSDNAWNIILDRRSVFSLYLLNDYDADFAVRFVTRDASDNIVNSLRSDSSDVNLELEQWFHVAVQYDGQTAKLFINGYLVDQSTDDFILTSSTNALNVAARYWGTYSRYLDGQIDEIRISDIPRYEDNLCPNRFQSFNKDDNTRLLLHLDTYTGTDLFDETRNFLGISLRSATNDANWESATTPVVLTQPQTLSVCEGSIANFNFDAYNTTNFQWQITSTDVFTDISDNSTFSGSNTNDLTVNTTGYTGNYLLRCIISNDNTFSCTDYASMNIWDNCTVWNGTSWSNGEPNNSMSAIIDANYSNSSDLNSDNLLVNQADTLFILPNNTFSTNYIENNGAIVLKAENMNKFSGALINQGNIVNYGSMIAENYIFSETPQIINNITNERVSFTSLLNENVNLLKFETNPGIWSNVDTNTNFTNTKAYGITANTAQIIDFEGTFNNTEFTFNLTEGWNLLFNPFPSPIDWENTTGWNKGDVQNTIYFIEPLNNGFAGNYSAYNGTVSTFSGSPYINSMQGFVVYANSITNVSVNKNAQIRTSDAQNFIPSTLNNILKFEFINTDNQSDEGIIYFTNQNNSIIKAEPFNSDKVYSFIYKSGQKYCISEIGQTIPDTTITVGFKTATAGNSTFKVTDFDFSVPVILLDMLTGDTTLLQLNTEYQFNATANEPLNRFKIYFGNYETSISSTINNNIKIYFDGVKIYVFANSDAHISVFDVIGRQIFSSNFKDNIVIEDLKTGVYIVKVSQNSFTKTQKIVIR